MDEIETATLAFQNATIAYQNASLAAQKNALLASLIQSGVTLLVYSGLALYGFRLIRQSCDESAQQHEQIMRDLEALIERTASKPDDPPPDA